jgi:type IV secretion system protein TrbE
MEHRYPVPAREPQPLAPLLPWGALIADDPPCIVGRHGLLQTTLAYRGPDTAALSEVELGVQAEQLNALFRRLQAKMAIWADWQRVAVREYPVATWPHPVAALVDEEQRVAFTTAGQHFETFYYLTLGWQPPGVGEARWFERALFRTPSPTGDNEFAGHVAEFAAIVKMLSDLLTPLMAEVQVPPPRETLTYLKTCCSTKRHPVNVPTMPLFLNHYLGSDEDLLPGTEPMLGNHHLRCISVRPTTDHAGFPESTTPVILQTLEDLPFAYRASLRWIPLGKAGARRMLESLFRKWSVREKSIMTMLMENILHQQSTRINPVAQVRKAEAEAAKGALLRDEVAYGYGTLTVVVSDPDLEVVTQQSQQVEAALNRQGFIAKVEDLNAVEAWLGTIPGDVSHMVRKPIISSLNIAHLVPHSAIWAGHARDEHLHDSPLCYGTTTGGTPFRVVLHQGEVGHTFIAGPTRAGKSGGLAYASLCWLRYDQAQVYLFDKQEALRGVTLALGGQHYRIGTEGQGGIQPFAFLDQGMSEQRWAAGWVADLLRHEGLTVGPQDHEHLWEALQSLATFPRPYRTLSGLQGLLPVQHLRQALTAFCQGGPYGALFDMQEDTLRLTAWTCFELQELLSLPRAVPPYLACVFHRMEQTFTGVPTLVGIDEAWTAFDSPVFAPKVRELLKAWGKANVSVILSTQDLVDAMQREQLWQAIQSACQTWIYLPNKAALREEVAPYYRRCGLNDQQLWTLAQATPRRDYYYLCPDGSRLFRLQLGPIAKAICASSSKEDLRLIDRLWATEGPEGFAQGLLRAKGLDWAADLLAGAAMKEAPDVDEDPAPVFESDAAP